jgi:hypothetical protein
MYQPYPTGAQMPTLQRPPIPPQVANAVKVMYARACRDGKNWARITGTVLFGLSTVDTSIGIAAPVAGTVKIWGAVVWLIALVAIVFLWQRDSTAFFKAVPR